MFFFLNFFFLNFFFLNFLKNLGGARIFLKNNIFGVSNFFVLESLYCTKSIFGISKNVQKPQKSGNGRGGQRARDTLLRLLESIQNPSWSAKSWAFGLPASSADFFLTRGLYGKPKIVSKGGVQNGPSPKRTPLLGVRLAGDCLGRFVPPLKSACCWKLFSKICHFSEKYFFFKIYFSEIYFFIKFKN
jgi:hypothetical protein